MIKDVDISQKNDYIEWLSNWFSKKVNLPSDAYSRNFFKEDWLDSFTTVELIVDIETMLNITLQDSHLQDARFSNILGLSELLHEIKSEVNLTYDN